MIILNDKQASYQVTNETETLKLIGQVTIKEEDDVITNFNGSFSKLGTNEYCGNFFYSEKADGKVNKQINDIDIQDIADIEKFLNDSVNELKGLIENDNE